MKKKLLAILLSAAMVVSLAACGSTSEESAQPEASVSTETTEKEDKQESETEEPANELDWINTESEWPVVKDGEEKRKLSIYVKVPSADAGKIEDSWLYQFLTDRSNLELEFTPFTSENASEFLSLAFASGELPDMIIGGGFSTADLIRYGASEGQIIDLAPYINETYMPNLTEVYEKYPNFKSEITDAEGRIWSLGFITNPQGVGYVNRMFLNYDWLEECGLEPPETLDEFIAAMKAMQDNDLAEHPIGGSYGTENPCKYILNAMGYLGANANGSNICLRNGQVVLPIADREVFGEYLKIMNQLYEEELIHPDFFTMDQSTTSAFLAEGTGAITQAAFIYDSDYTKYWAATPLTSEWNDTPQWNGGNTVTVGGAVVTSACEYPEAAVKFLDWVYREYKEGEYLGSNYRLSIVGYEEDDDPSLFYNQPKEHTPEGRYWYSEYVNNIDSYANLNDFLYKHITIWQNSTIGFDTLSFIPDHPYYDDGIDWAAVEDPASQRHTHEKLTAAGDYAWRIAVETGLVPYVVETYPNNVFLDEATATAMTDLRVAFNEYATQEIAKFITGARPLTDDELTKYFDTMDSLGAQEYVQTYADYYASK